MAYILVVDDEKDIADLSAMALSNAGHEVSIELDIGSAEKSMHERIPDLVVLDVMFPGNDTEGFELARKMKHLDPKLRDIPIIMITGVNQELSLGFCSDDIDDFYLPVTEFLEKPVDLEHLCDKVAELLS